MKTRSVVISAVSHVALLIAVTVTVPWAHTRDIAAPPPIMVEFAEIDELTQAPTVGKARTMKEQEPPKPEAPPPSPPKSNPAPPSPPVEETPPPPEPAPPKEAEKPKPEPEKKPVEKPKPPKPKEEPKPKEREPQRDFSSVLTNLTETDAPAEKSDTPDMKLNEPAAPDGLDAVQGPKLTITEEDALRRQLAGCWSVPAGGRDIDTMSVDIRLRIRPDRTLESATILDQSRYNSDSFFRAFADSAVRAVRNPACSPLQVPPDKYETWKTTVVTFSPKDMF